MKPFPSLTRQDQIKRIFILGTISIIVGGIYYTTRPSEIEIKNDNFFSNIISGKQNQMKRWKKYINESELWDVFFRYCKKKKFPKPYIILDITESRTYNKNTTQYFYNVKAKKNTEDEGEKTIGTAVAKICIHKDWDQVGPEVIRYLATCVIIYHGKKDPDMISESPQVLKEKK